MNAGVHGPVVAGVDGTTEAMAAARYAAWEASRRRVGLRLIHAFQPTPMWGPATLVNNDYVWEQSWVRDLLSMASKEIGGQYPDLPIEAAAISASPAGALVTEAHHASLVVVGTRAMPGLRGHLAGSVAAQVATYAESPVLVIRAAAPTTVDPDTFGSLPILVGLDGSPQSDSAMAAAVDEAIARNTSVRAIFVWDDERIFDMGAAAAETLGFESDPAKVDRLLAEATAGWSERYPELKITRECVHSSDTVDALCTAASTAGLLVVGSRGRGGFLGLRLGSTVDAMVRRSSVPVLVVRGSGRDKQ